MADRSEQGAKSIDPSIEVKGQTFDSMYADVFVRAAFERFLEILSEASRSIPTHWKQEHGPTIPWRQVGDLGNVLRHTYHRTDMRMLWEVYEKDLTPLEGAIDAMLAAYDRPDGEG